MADAFQDMAAERDRFEVSLGDTLDVKAGVLLALIAVVATLTAGLLASSKIGRVSGWIELAGLGVLIVAGIYAFLTLQPRDYMLPELPEAYESWRNQVASYYSDPADVEAELKKGLASVAFQRIDANHKNDRAKSRLLFRSFSFTLAALVLNCITLATPCVSKILS